ncbi:MAG: cell division topological specificity factor MinE [Firmicutes bacterium]|nr:cell division topological specificity factor MinE [Bacillota bacterium]
MSFNLFKFFNNSKPSSKDTAKDRLKLILINDRSSISPETLNKIKEEILVVISKYVDIEISDIDVKMTKTDDEDGNSPALVASIPIKHIK